MVKDGPVQLLLRERDPLIDMIVMDLLAWTSFRKLKLVHAFVIDYKTHFHGPATPMSILPASLSNTNSTILRIPVA